MFSPNLLFPLLVVFTTARICASAEEENADKQTKRQIGPMFAAPGMAGCAPAGYGACACPPAIGGAMVGCAPPIAALPPPPPAPVPPVPPVPAGRLIPQALPGAPCEPGVECTGGSVCSMGICLCPPELVQEGTVCVSRTIYGVVPGAPPPMPPPPPPPAYGYPAPPPPLAPAFAPAPYPAAVPAAPPPMPAFPVAAAPPPCPPYPGYAGYGA